MANGVNIHIPNIVQVRRKIYSASTNESWYYTERCNTQSYGNKYILVVPYYKLLDRKKELNQIRVIV